MTDIRALNDAELDGISGAANLYQASEWLTLGDSRIGGEVIQDGNRGGCHGPGHSGAF